MSSESKHKVLGGVVASVAVLVGIAFSVGLLPWATQRDLMRVENDVSLLERNHHALSLTLAKDVATMKSDLEHIKGTQKEMSTDIAALTIALLRMPRQH